MSITLRLKFKRVGPVKYLGHLDMLRYFQKAMQRAEIDIRYSEGFNPHQIMSFAYPLGVSMETEGDYLDIDVNSMESIDEIRNRLNTVMKEGIEIVSAAVVPEGETAAMASVFAADYKVVLSQRIKQEDIDAFMKQEKILVVKEGKKKNTEVDLKEGILKLELLSADCLFLCLKSGSSMNVKPIQVIQAFNAYLKTEYRILEICRVEIYKADENGTLSALGEFYEQ